MRKHKRVSRSLAPQTITSSARRLLKRLHDCSNGLLSYLNGVHQREANRRSVATTPGRNDCGLASADSPIEFRTVFVRELPRCCRGKLLISPDEIHAPMLGA